MSRPELTLSRAFSAQMSFPVRSKVAALAAPAAAAALLMQAFVAAAAPSPASSCDVPGLRDTILRQVNAVRARGASCGGRRFGAAGSVAWNERLAAAAAGHSRDMAQNDYFSHDSLRGTQASHRADAQGYRWLAVGENIAAGEDFRDSNVVAGWMNSPAHCNNIMDPEYSEVAVACVARPGTTYGRYWTMMLGRR